MRILLLSIIRAYWFLIPMGKRRKCIFKKSCSKYVYDETKNKGLVVGLKALQFRVKNCRPQYDIFIDYKTNANKVVLKSEKIVDEHQIAERLI